VYVARTYAYVAAGADGLVIVDAERPEQLREYSRYNANGRLSDSRDVVVATTNASAFAYVADGKGGLKVLQLTSPDSQPKFYGYSPEPKPELIAEYATGKPALSLSKGLDRDRAVDETGGQIAVFGRKGSRPLNLDEMRRLYLDTSGKPWFVSDDAGKAASR
jgi:LVIVD repeat